MRLASAPVSMSALKVFSPLRGGYLKKHGQLQILPGLTDLPNCKSVGGLKKALVDPNLSGSRLNLQKVVN